ncbi:hypothetical protein [Polymorphum gilvum]|uniref:Uncharacterized protein n=1 Tax=Polymorphum gilvum (strain LMG 25793 / CGMCC 1.9160 / SL003B-26A1) TaxID=991905 RepID=F2J0B3_POLGS|nr:hypothetical protein [Polymorphum gilvum]ADZ68647.1 hypothetical protein SL003B_0209 [Polymorphum gilvum SL003B-26A1]
MKPDDYIGAIVPRAEFVMTAVSVYDPEPTSDDAGFQQACKKAHGYCLPMTGLQHIPEFPADATTAGLGSPRIAA